MSTKSHRSGRKFSSSHTTVIPVAAIVADIAHNIDEVTGISLGFIKSGLSTSRGGGRVKISFGNKGHVLLQVRGNTSQQEIHVTTRCLQSTKLAIAKKVRDANLSITFEKKL